IFLGTLVLQIFPQRIADFLKSTKVSSPIFLPLSRFTKTLELHSRFLQQSTNCTIIFSCFNASFSWRKSYVAAFQLKHGSYHQCV
ncbi:hypothetical protein A4A49_53881, partial [Nicotiana attenuata]